MGKGKRAQLTYERMAALVSSSPASDANAASLTPLKRIQSIDYSFDVNKKIIKQLNSYEFIKADPDQTYGVKRLPSVTQPTVSVDLAYLFCSGENEEAIGFGRGPNSSILKDIDDSEGKDDVNLIVLGHSSSQRKDILQSGVNLSGFDGCDVLGFGNSYLTKYSYSSAVGQFTKCDLSYVCSNASFDAYHPDSNPDIDFPSVNPQNTNSMGEDFFSSNPLSGILFKDPGFKQLNEVSAIRPGEIRIDISKNDPDGFSTLILDNEDIAVQNVDLALNFDRADIQGLGSDYVHDRKIKYPVVGDLSMDFIVREFNTDTKLSGIFAHDADYTIKVQHQRRDPSTETALFETFDVVSMQIDHAKLKTENLSASIGGPATVSTSFVFEVTPFTGMSLTYGYEQSVASTPPSG
jgi:hypothetical protein